MLLLFKNKLLHRRKAVRGGRDSEHVCRWTTHDDEICERCYWFFTYDAIRMFETIPDRHQAESSKPEMFFNFYRTMNLNASHLNSKNSCVNIFESA